jgi:hypothetical protein
MRRDTTSTYLAGATAVAVTLAGPVLAAGLDPAGMDWLVPLNHYCERVAVGLWNEPLNAGSNLAFLVAAAIILIRQQQAGWSDRTLVLLAMLAGTVGVGSILFHTFANGWSLVADMLPIAVFIYAFFFVALRRFLHLGAVSAVLATVGLYLAAPALETLFRPLLGASATYAPGLFATLGVALAVPVMTHDPAPRLLVAAGFAFSMALVFRMLDQPLCATLSSGTHFLWHVFNGVAIGLALLAAEVRREETSGPRVGRRSARRPGVIA